MNFIVRSALFLNIIVFSLMISGQALDQTFLDSLPQNIKDDLKKQSRIDRAVEDVNVPTPQTRIQNLENALDEAKETLKRIEDNIGLDSQQVGEIKRFGSKFFDSFQSTFLPINDPNSDPSYILDSGDILTLQLVGQVNEVFDLRIRRNGAINVPDLGDINLAGLTLSEGVELTKNAIKSGFIGTQAFLSLSELRDMNVMIVGNVRKPGMYTLSGGSSALGLIRAAGGVDNFGSYRKILHKRNGVVINTLDLYSILIEGDTSNMSQLRSGDTIIVNPSSLEVQISGGIANPAIYEILENENLKDLFRFAGRLNEQDLEKITIKRRSASGEFVEFIISENDISSFSLARGDSVEVPYVMPRFSETRKVIISGEVNIPGTYYLDNNTRLSDLIKKAGGYTENAYPMAAVFTRESAVNTELALKDRSYNELLRFLIASQGRSTLSSNSLVTFLSLLKEYEPSGRVITEFELSELRKNPSKDRIMAAGDKIHVPAFANQVYVYGEVLNPSSYDYSPDLNYTDYLKLSGGFSRSADENKIILISPDGTATSIKIGLFSSVLGNKQILPGSLIYVPQYIGKVDGISLASAVAPIVSSFALSIASLNSINN